MQALNLPSFDYKIKSFRAGRHIFDSIRKKYVQLTPEEWVRQHFLHYLTDHLAYPRALMKIEQGMQYNHRQHRADILVYNRCGHPLLLAECKAPHIPLNQDTWAQIARYNAQINAHLLVMTNGLEHRCWCVDYKQGNHVLLSSVPSFDRLVESDCDG